VDDMGGNTEPKYPHMGPCVHQGGLIKRKSSKGERSVGGETEP
jgi:hypothetical protein